MSQKQVSHDYRHAHADLFVKLPNGKYGGYKKRVGNGPAPSTKRGKRRGK